jgi:ribosomal protein S6--L-glutamate ligase
VKVAILSILPDTFSVKSLVEEGTRRGHEVKVVNYLKCAMQIRPDQSTLTYEGESLRDVDVVIARISSGYTMIGCAVVRQFEMMGVYCVNGSLGIARSKDKLRSLQIMARKGMSIPPTAFSHSTPNVDGLIKSVGGAPVIIKLIEGTQGIGVVKADTKQAAESVLEAFRGLNANMIVQEYIAESEGADIRVFVVGDKVVASMIRRAAEGEFRANLHRGGKAEKIKITAAERALAIRAAKEMKLSVAGVDIIRSHHGPMVLEINSSPGLEGISGSTGVNVAGSIFDFIEVDRIKTGKKTGKVTI